MPYTHTVTSHDVCELGVEMNAFEIRHLLSDAALKG